MTEPALKDIVASVLETSLVEEWDEQSSPQAICVLPGNIRTVCEQLISHEKTWFDSLSCLTAIDNGPEKNTMEVVYNLYSIPHHLQLMIRVTLDRANPVIDSVADIWRTADWHEREAYDLLGIHFQNHPDLRRILMPADWEGFPLRKDYEVQENYHGIKVKY